MAEEPPSGIPKELKATETIYWNSDLHGWEVEHPIGTASSEISKGSTLKFDSYDKTSITYLDTTYPEYKYNPALFYKSNLFSLIDSGILVPTEPLISMENTDSPKLKFLVLKDIWLATTGPMEEATSKMIGWYSEKPPYDNGHIEKGTEWIYDHMYEDVLVFGRIENGELVSDWAEFTQEELEMLARDGVIELIDKDSSSPPSSSSFPSSSLLSWPIKDFGEFSKYADSIAEKYIDQSILSSCDYIIDKRDTIEFPFAVDYKNEWGIWEGIREIIQNSMDTETRLDIYTPDPNTLVIHDEGKGLSIKDFRLGGGEKAKLEESKKYNPNCNPEKLIRGAHGEGMKLTFLVLSKEPEKYKFYHYSRCIKATAEFVMSQRFKEQTLDIYLDPIKPHRGTTFILNTYSNIISKLLTYCKTRFVYHNLYINGEKSTHTEYDMLTKYTSDDNNKIILKLIGHIVDMHIYDPLKDVDKPLYIRGIYVRDVRTVFSYDFICPYLDSARNIVDISQIKEQIKRIYTHLEFKGINPSTVAERFVRTIHDGRDIDFIENNISFYSHDITTRARDVYRKVWDEIFGKNAFIPSDPTLTQLAMEQLYVERDATGNIVREVHYKQIKTPYILERIFLASDVPKDSDIVVQQTIDVSYSMEKIKKEEPQLIKNLREAISVLCPIYKLNTDEEIEKWDAFLIEYKAENQPPRNLWKNWDNIEVGVREDIFGEILDLYKEFSSYPIIIEKGLNLPISDRSKTTLGEIISEHIYKMKKSEIISKHPDIAKEIEKYENRIIPVKHKLGSYDHARERFGIRYDCLVERDKTFTVVIHEYAHKMREVDDIDDYDSAMGKILSVIQNGYGIILNESFLYADEIYEHYILKTIMDNISSVDMPDSTREEILDRLKELPDSISEVVFEMCADKKHLPGSTRTYVEELAELERQEAEESTETRSGTKLETKSEDKNKEEELRREKEIWEKVATLHEEEYIRTEGFTRTENNLDYMLKNYSWDAANKTLEENIAFDARYTSFGDVYVVKIERLTEPLATNYDKENLPGNYPGTFYDNVAYLNNGHIFAYNLRKDGKYPNIPWSVATFERYRLI